MNNIQISKLVLAICIAFILISTSCTENSLTTNYNESISLVIPGNPYEWVGQIHNEILTHFLQVDSNMSFAIETPQILFDSIFTYLRVKYPDSTFSELNDFLDVYYDSLICKINNNQPIFDTPGDTVNHNIHFALVGASQQSQSMHYLIDGIVNDEYYLLNQRLSALEEVLYSLDTMNIDSNELIALKCQISLARYSAIFWEQTPLLEFLKDGDYSIQQNEQQRKAMNRDINGADQDAFCESLAAEVSVFMLTASIFTEGFSGGAALVAAAIVGTAASANRYGTIKSHHWYGT